MKTIVIINDSTSQAAMRVRNASTSLFDENKTRKSRLQTPRTVRKSYRPVLVRSEAVIAQQKLLADLAEAFLSFASCVKRKRLTDLDFRESDVPASPTFVLSGGKENYGTR